MSLHGISRNAWNRYAAGGSWYYEIEDVGYKYNMTDLAAAIGLGMLLSEGIGDTIRISLAADPVEEVRVGFDILKSLHIRNKGINIIACPSCSRQEFDVIKTVNELESRLEDVLEHLDVAVIGCVVNGPGEAREAHLGVAGGSPNLLYVDGKPSHKIDNETLVDELERQIRARIREQQEARDSNLKTIPIKAIA